MAAEKQSFWESPPKRRAIMCEEILGLQTRFLCVGVYHAYCFPILQRYQLITRGAYYACLLEQWW